MFKMPGIKPPVLYHALFEKNTLLIIYGSYNYLGIIDSPARGWGVIYT